MDRKAVADRKWIAVLGAAILAIALVFWIASRSLAEPKIEANIPAGPNARTEDPPEH